MATIVETNDEWIRTRTGISNRHFADKETNLSLGMEAAEKALEMAGISKEEIGVVICATITPDNIVPSQACMLQKELGLPETVFAFDICAACTGFLYAVHTARSLLCSMPEKKYALVVASEVLSRVTNFADRNTCVLFGDGAGAAVLQASTGEEGEGSVLATDIGSDGSLHDLLQIPGGGSRCPTTAENAHERLATLAMRGNETFRHAVTRMKASAASVIERAGLTADDIQLIIPHQANLRIINAVAQRLSIPEDKVFVNIEKYGNTSAAAVAIAFDEARRSGRFGKGDNVVLVTFGAGLTWSAAVIRW